MVEAPDGTTPRWMIAGKANAQAITEELLKTKSEDELPAFAREYLEESRSQPPDTLILQKYDRKPDEMDMSEHFLELYVQLRKVAKIISIITVIVMVLPGVNDGVLAVNPYEPAVLQILSAVINYAKTSLVGGSLDRGDEVHLYIGSPLAPIALYFSTALFISIVISLPLSVREIMVWVKPGLTVKEYQVLKQVAGVATVLFAIGAVLSFTVIMPVTLRILAASGIIIGGESLEVWYGIEPVLNLLMWGTLGAGILYASPMILLALVQLEVLPAYELVKRRREIMFGVFTVAAIVTPDPTLVSMVILSLPMVVIIEGVIYWGLKIETQKALEQSFN